MITIHEDFTPKQFYPGICQKNRKLLFFDIETTGFSREFHRIYLIGAASCRNGQWRLMQWLAQNPEEEADVIRAFLEYSADYDTLIHFNGQRFDLPFTQARANAVGAPWTLRFEESIDLMELIKPYKTLCGLTNCRQKTIEQLLSLSSREDTMNGGELIPVYYRYLQKQDPESLRLLLLHNADDVREMTELTQVARFPEFFHSDFQYLSSNNNEQGILLHFESSKRMPVLLHADLDYWQFSAGGNSLSLGVRFFNTQLKHFYKNYKDYYYLPEEDLVIHKSVAAFVDKKQKQKATRQNCCIKHQGNFLPQPELLVTPEFCEKPGSKLTWFAADDWKPDPKFAADYLHSVLNQFIKK